MSHFKKSTTTTTIWLLSFYWQEQSLHHPLQKQTTSNPCSISSDVYLLLFKLYTYTVILTFFFNLKNYLLNSIIRWEFSFSKCSLHPIHIPHMAKWVQRLHYYDYITLFMAELLNFFFMITSLFLYYLKKIGAH